MPDVGQQGSGTTTLSVGRTEHDYDIYFKDGLFNAITSNPSLTNLSNADFVTLIEAAWSALNGIGGGTIFLSGQGTWTLNSQLNSQGDYVQIESNRSLILKLANGVNDIPFFIAHMYVSLIRVRLDGNKAYNTIAGVCAGIEWNGGGTNSADFGYAEGCWTQNCYGFGLSFYVSNDCTAYMCKDNDATDNGICLQGTGTTYYRNMIIGCNVSACSNVGIGLVQQQNSIVADCVVYNISHNDASQAYNSHWGIGLEGACAYCTVVGCTVDHCDVYGIDFAQDSEYDTAVGCTITNCGACLILNWHCVANGNTITAIINSGMGIVCQGGDDLACGNIIFGQAANSVEGIRIAGGNAYVSDNKVYTCVKAVNIQNDGDYAIVKDNYISSSVYGIDVASGAASCVLVDNDYASNTYNIRDLSSTTIYRSFQVPFIKEVSGSWVTTSPIGIGVDHASDTALTMGSIPDYAYQIRKIKVYGVALGTPIGAGGQMHMDFVFNAGVGNAAYTTVTFTLTSFDSLEADYVANDVVSWQITEGDVSDVLGTLVTGDSFEFKAVYRAGSNPDGASNANVRNIEIYYI